MRILYIGSGDIGLPALEWLVGSGHEIAGLVTQPDKPGGRSMELMESPVKQFALRHGLPVFQPKKIRAEDSVAHIRGVGADLIMVMAYGQILPVGVLEAARIACINLHASILPRHRGAAPIQSAILAGDRESGITVMYMDAGLDTGDILLTRRLPIRRDETGGSLHDRIAEVTPGALAEAVGLLAAGNAPRVPQDVSLATYAPKLTREDGEIRWDRGCIEVSRHVRAMNPWPGAFTFMPDREGRPLKFKVYEVAQNPRRSGPPGEVLRADARGILVGCGAGSVLLRQVQIEGKRRMAAKDFLIGKPVPAGVRLGERDELSL
jgi:methionyl-tRNA formyltransferase